MTESLQPLIRLIDDDPAVLQAMSFLLTVEGLANRTFLSAETFFKRGFSQLSGGGRRGSQDARHERHGTAGRTEDT